MKEYIEIVKEKQDLNDKRLDNHELRILKEA